MPIDSKSWKILNKMSNIQKFMPKKKSISKVKKVSKKTKVKKKIKPIKKKLKKKN